MFGRSDVDRNDAVGETAPLELRHHTTPTPPTGSAGADMESIDLAT